MRKALRDRQQRQEMGEEAYDRMVAETKSPQFAWFGLAFVLILGVVFFAMSYMGL